MIDTDDNVIQFSRIHPLRREFAPGVIHGPYTKDSQEHHEWEDAETLRRLPLRNDVVSLLMTWARWTAGAVVVAALIGAALSVDWVNVFVRPQ